MSVATLFFQEKLFYCEVQDAALAAANQPAGDSFKQNDVVAGSSHLNPEDGIRTDFLDIFNGHSTKGTVQVSSRKNSEKKIVVKIVDGKLADGITVAHFEHNAIQRNEERGTKISIVVTRDVTFNPQICSFISITLIEMYIYS